MALVPLVFAVLTGHPSFGGAAAAIGIVAYVVLGLLRGILCPLIVWLLTRNAPTE